MNNQIEALRQQNEDLKNKLLTMRCEAKALAELLAEIRTLESGQMTRNEVEARLRKLAE